jgi:3-methyladenine DNA glycosylase AlkD
MVKLHPSHKEILQEIERNSGKLTDRTFLESYLGSNHPQYAISAPVLRKILKEWASKNTSLSPDELRDVVSSLIHGRSITEKIAGGVLLGYAKPTQRKFDIAVFDDWLDQLQGWAEVDSLCTGKFMLLEVPPNFNKWKPLLKRWTKDKKIEKRRASLVVFCSPISHCDDDAMGELALANIDKLKGEKEVLITKAISWLLRSMIHHHRAKVVDYLEENRSTLPAIAVRETMVKLQTGRKNKLIRNTN